MLARLYAFGCLTLAMIVPAVAQTARVTSDPSTVNLPNGVFSPLSVDNQGRLWLANPGAGGGGGVASTVTANQGTAGSTAWPVTLPSGTMVNVGNFPSTQAVSGTVVLGAGTAAIGSVSVSNFPATQPVSGTVALGAGSAAIGSVSVSNLPATQPVSGSVSVANFPASQAVTGAFFQATQPVSAASLPLPSGAATAANQTSWQGSATGGASATLAGLAAGRYNATTPTLTDGQQAALQVDANGNLKVTGISGGGGGATGSVTSAGTSGSVAQAVQGITGGVPLPVSGTFFQATQPISAASLPLPTGAATAANQPSFSTAGSPSTQVLTVQGIPGGTAQPVSISAGSSSIGGLGVSVAAGGVGNFSRIASSAATTNATSVKTSQGRLYKFFACNTSTTAAYVRFYNLATAPTVGTSTVLFSRPIPPAGAVGGMACASYDMADIGWSFSVGIAYAITGGAADNDTTALTAGQIVQISAEYQ